MDTATSAMAHLFSLGESLLPTAGEAVRIKSAQQLVAVGASIEFLIWTDQRHS